MCRRSLAVPSSENGPYEWPSVIQVVVLLVDNTDVSSRVWLRPGMSKFMIESKSPQIAA